MKLFNNAISPCVQIERERDIYLIALKMYNHSTDQVMETMESHPNSEFEVCCCVGPCGLQHARLPGPSPSPRVCSNSCPLSQWCHPTISYSVAPFSSCPQSIPASGSFPALHINWPKSWSFSFSTSPYKEYSGLTSFRMDWFDLLSVQGSLKRLLHYNSSKTSILQHSTFFMVQLWHLHDFWKNHSFDYMVDLCGQSDVSAF